MTTAVVLGLAMIGLAVVAALAPPAQAADAQNGEKLAQRWCVSCHVVGPGQRAASADTPPFSAIASRSGFTAAEVALFLLTPHPRMPDMNLSRAEAADLAAYIAAQRR
ncbi:MAG: c-type cytochrome [Xanthobacteraceae bacterium]|nr:MAG: c-type cytochrome [Xanthobacteraceae bacterium]